MIKAYKRKLLKIFDKICLVVVFSSYILGDLFVLIFLIDHFTALLITIMMKKETFF